MLIDRLLASVVFGNCCRCGEKSWAAVCSRCEGRAPVRFTTSQRLEVLGLRPYDRVLAPWIHRLKYRDETLVACRLGSALACIFPPEWQACALVPVPLHPNRLAERGFNQSALLARALGKGVDAPVSTNLLSRKTATLQQATLSNEQRTHNIENAFEASGRSSGRQVVLIDDVATTGSTLDGCRLALENRGASVVGALCCALSHPTTIFGLT